MAVETLAMGGPVAIPPGGSIPINPAKKQVVALISVVVLIIIGILVMSWRLS